MKAKDLIKILKKNPEYEVYYYESIPESLTTASGEWTELNWADIEVDTLAKEICIG